MPTSTRYAGGYKHIREQGIEALTTAVHLEYHRSAGFHDVLRIWTRCTGIRGARFRYEYRVELDGELVAEAYTTHATVDRATYRPTRVPAWLVEAITRAEATPAAAKASSGQAWSGQAWSGLVRPVAPPPASASSSSAAASCRRGRRSSRRRSGSSRPSRT